MKRKILLLTTIYPAPDLKYGTSAIHYFTREWVRMGYEVNVIHYQAVYLKFFYLMAKLFREKIASKTGAVVFTQRDKGDKRYIMDGVTVYRFPIFKNIPHGKFTKRVIKKHITKVIQTNSKEDFVPDIIIGHFSNPQLEIIHELKKIYSARTCLVMHDIGNSIKKVYGHDYQKFMNSIDIWGYRSIPIQRGFENKFGRKKRSFLCYSGIPEKYISQTNDRNFSSDLKRFVYVGDFIKLKNVISLIYAVKEVYPDNQFEISLIGKGAEEKSIRDTVFSLGIEFCVKFLGRISRDEVQKIMEDSDYFIMISSPEAFGLVYLEAMAKGCITIGSKNEGIDGVIKHGCNGFLCKPGNVKELAIIIRHINNLSSNEKKKISKNAINTTRNLTDYKVAKQYIQAIDY